MEDVIFENFRGLPRAVKIENVIFKIRHEN